MSKKAVETLGFPKINQEMRSNRINGLEGSIRKQSATCGLNCAQKIGSPEQLTTYGLSPPLERQM